ncbi:hypothetical protein [Candidatus Albibeggiatoa sp. nov. NOAA]|uniref:hypothetical protein n=1 Tax=Candidatus Albibeggiatoa sp. nov. NOAA TaxID=3162724 RepID=UPI0033025CC9|nr:hypothetical protein [Thiotrichaceae bacterium]
MTKYPNGLIALNSHINNQQIIPEISISEMTQFIEAGHTVILKNVFDVQRLLTLRQAVCDWAEKIPEHPITKTASVPDLNYHRRDNVSDPKYMTRLFHQYGFSNLDNLEASLQKQLKDTVEPLLNLQNQLAQTNFDLSMPNCRFKLYNHNSGGGFFDKHTHPYIPQKVAFFLSFSRFEQDFKQGHVMFDTPFGSLAINDLFEIGNVIYFKYDLPHGVATVDSSEPLDWASDKGLWVLSAELITNYEQSKKVAV